MESELVKKKTTKDSQESDTQKSEKPIDLMDIESAPGIGPQSKKKLEEAGVSTLYDLCIRGGMEINELSGIGMDKVSLAMKYAWSAIQGSGVMRPDSTDPMELYTYRLNMVRIPLKCDALDSLLRGRFEPEALYEVYGENGAGKMSHRVHRLSDRAPPISTVVSYFH